MTGTARPLSGFETFFAAGSAVIWMWTRLRGPLDAAALTGALRALRAAHPVLDCRLDRGPDGFTLVEGPADEGADPIELVASPSTPPLQPPPGLGESLVAVRVVSCADEHLMLFGVHHAISDARSTEHYARWLWSAYTAIVTTGQAPVTDPAPLPVAPEVLLAARGIHPGPTSGLERTAGAVWGGSGPITSPVGPGSVQRQIELTADQTAALSRAARRHGLSMHGAVCGAILLGERSAVADPAVGPAGLAVRSAVDVRERVSPPIGVTEGTNLVGMAYRKVAVQADSDPFALGADVLTGIADDLASGLVQQQIYHALTDVQRPVAPLIYISNIGELPRLDLPDGVVVDGRGGLVTFAPDIAAEMATGVAPGSAEPLGEASLYAVYRTGGRLVIEANYPGGAFTAAQLDALAETVHAALVRMGAAG